jgi:hypothetical protein
LNALETMHKVLARKVFVTTTRASMLEEMFERQMPSTHNSGSLGMISQDQHQAHEREDQNQTRVALIGFEAQQVDCERRCLVMSVQSPPRTIKSIVAEFRYTR